LNSRYCCAQIHEPSKAESGGAVLSVELLAEVDEIVERLGVGSNDAMRD